MGIACAPEKWAQLGAIQIYPERFRQSRLRGPRKPGKEIRCAKKCMPKHVQALTQNKAPNGHHAYVGTAVPAYERDGRCIPWNVQQQYLHADLYKSFFKSVKYAARVPLSPVG